MPDTAPKKPRAATPVAPEPEASEPEASSSPSFRALRSMWVDDTPFRAGEEITVPIPDDVKERFLARGYIEGLT